MVTPTAGLRPEQILQQLASIGVSDPEQLAVYLRDIGFVPPPKAVAALGQLAQPVMTAPPQGRELPPAQTLPVQGARPPAGSDPRQRPSAAPPAPPPPKPTPPQLEAEQGSNLFEALAAIRPPAAPTAAPVMNLTGATPRLGGSIDPRLLEALLQLLGAGQGGAVPGPALGNLIGGR